MLKIFHQFLDQITEILHLIKPRIQIGLAVVAMATLVPMTAFPQANESAREVTSSVAEISVGNTPQLSGENNTISGFSKNSDFQTLPNVATNFGVGVQTQFNEIRRELLDERASSIDLWLAVIGIVLTFFAVVVVIAGFIGFRKIREIEEEAKASAKRAAAAEEDAKHHLQEILNIREEAASNLSDIHADFADTNPMEAYQTLTNIRANPDASLVDKTIADAVSLQQQGKRKDAIKKWCAIAEISEKKDNELAARAWLSIGYLSSNEDVDKALFSYDRAIQLKPDMAVAYYNRANAKRRLRRHEDAIADFDIAIQLKPDMVEAYSNRGNVKGRLGQHEDAIADIDIAIQLSPDRAEAYSNRGNVKHGMGHHEDAIADFDIAIKLDPDIAEAYSNRGISKSELGQHEDAIADFDIAIQLDPDMAEAYSNRGNVKHGMGHHEDAIADFDRAIQLNPNIAEAYSSRGISKYELGFKVEAKLNFETALRLARKIDNVGLIKLVEQRLHSLSAINGD